MLSYKENKDSQNFKLKKKIKIEYDFNKKK